MGSGGSRKVSDVESWRLDANTRLGRRDQRWMSCGPLLC
jgi:hypothetical protein